MSIKGQLNFVNNPTEFFTPVVLGGKPSGGYTPATGVSFTVELHGILGGFFYFTVSASSSTVDGTFELPNFPLNLPAETVWVTVSLTGSPYYRSELFPLANTGKGLNIYMYQPDLPRSAGITAGTISKVLSGAGLPGNTQIKATPWGLNLSGSKSQANIQFGVLMAPDTSPNIALFLDLSLNGWNIHVGWPEDWCESATDILNSIRSGLQSADSSTNQVVLQQIKTTLQAQFPNVPAAGIQSLINAVSFQFVTLIFDNNYSWPMSNTTDKTIVLSPVVAIGYPPRW